MVELSAGTLYTIGQRFPLGSSNRRHYVVDMESEDNRIVVGEEEKLYSTRVLATEVSRVGGKPKGELLDVAAKIRYRSPEVPAVLSAEQGYIEAEFDSPQRVVTPGQAIVFYQEDKVIGGGTIARPD